MRVVAIVLSLLLSFPLFSEALAQDGMSAKDSDAPQMERTVTGDIAIAADGSVHSYTLDDELIPALAEALDKSIRHWRFEPITVDGRPVIAETSMRIDLRLEPLGERFRFRVADVHFGAPERSSQMRPPDYPRAALHAGLGAKVVLVVKIDAEGNVENVHAEQVSLDHRVRSESEAARWRERFAEVSVDAARHWSFDPATRIDGESIAVGSIRVPVTYSIGRGGPEQWQAYVPGPYSPAPWVEQKTPDLESIAKLEDGEMQLLDPRFNLLGDVVGSLL